MVSQGDSCRRPTGTGQLLVQGKSQLGKESLTGGSPGLFDAFALLAGFCAYIDPSHNADYTQFPAPASDKSLILVGLGSAKAMIEVGNLKHKIMCLAQTVQNQQQSQRICPAGHTNDNRATPREQFFFLDKAGYIGQKFIHETNIKMVAVQRESVRHPFQKT
jgi:hypothetical protein